MAIPVTLAPRTSLIFDHAAMNSLTEKKLGEWADRLLSLGIAPESVVFAAANPDMPREKVQSQLIEICEDLEIDTNRGFAELKEDAHLQEYVAGHLSAPHVLFTCNRFRIKTNFPEQLTVKLVYDKGQERVTYYGLESGITGSELESLCLNHLTANGIVRSLQ